VAVVEVGAGTAVQIKLGCSGDEQGIYPEVVVDPFFKTSKNIVESVGIAALGEKLIV
jgi:hypothetical protein